MKTALVIEGGAMRGLFAAGVLDSFLDNNIEFDGISGTSAGAVFGINYVSKQRGRSLRYNQKYMSDRRYMSVGSLIRTGNIFNTEFAYEILPRELDLFDEETFSSSKIPFYACVTSVTTGKAEYFQMKCYFGQEDILRASASMPFFSKPVKIGDDLYLDGGVADSIPYKGMQDMGYERFVIIQTREKGYTKKAMSPLLIKLGYGREKAFADTMLHRHELYNSSLCEIEEMEKAGTAFAIRPPEPLNISRIEKNPDELQRVYDIGLNEGNKCLDRLREFLK